MRDNELSGFTRRRKLDNPTNVSIEIARIRKIHPHMFRHTFVSILLSNPDIGVATVAAEAGHAQPSTTLAIYTQVYQKRQDSIRSQMSKTLYEPIYRSDDPEK